MAKEDINHDQLPNTCLYSQLGFVKLFFNHETISISLMRQKIVYALLSNSSNDIYIYMIYHIYNIMLNINIYILACI